MITIEKDGREIQATEKAFELLYRHRGFEKVDTKEKEKEEEDKKDEEVVIEEGIPLEKRTAEELREMGKRAEIKGYYRMTKAELIEELK